MAGPNKSSGHKPTHKKTAGQKSNESKGGHKPKKASKPGGAKKTNNGNGSSEPKNSHQQKSGPKNGGTKRHQTPSKAPKTTHVHIKNVTHVRSEFGKKQTFRFMFFVSFRNFLL